MGGQSTDTFATSQLGAERIEPGAPVLPELIKPVINFQQRSRIDGVKSPRSFGAHGGKTGLPEHSQVLRHRRLSYAKLRRDRCHHRTGRMLPQGQELEDPTPDGITEDIQRVHTATLSIDTYISQSLSLYGLVTRACRREDGTMTREEQRGRDSGAIASYDYARRRGTHELDWDACFELASGLAEALEPLHIDAVVGIARAGLIPAATIALCLRRDMFPVRLSRRINDEVRYDSPVWWIGVPPEVAGLRVALVDEIADSGETLKLARQTIMDAGAVDVVTACLVQHSWANPAPTFSGLISDELIIFPWNRRVLRDGAWLPHPELEAALALLPAAQSASNHDAAQPA